MTDYVDETLRIWRTSDFERGSRDCLLSIADYVLSVDGVDHGVKYRGQYSDAQEADSLIARDGGAVAMIDASGLSRVQVAQRGDIVLVRVGREEIAGICTGDGVAFRRQRGVSELAIKMLKIVAIWRCAGLARCDDNG